MPKPKSKRGGRRPGAGAPRGNLNALRHGRRSQQLAQIGALLAADPELQLTLLDLGRRHLDRQAKAQEVAALWLTRLLEHAEKIARGEPSRGPFAHLLKEEPCPEPGASRSRRNLLKDKQSKKRPRTRSRTNTNHPRTRAKTRTNNQTPNETTEINQPANTKKARISND